MKQATIKYTENSWRIYIKSASSPWSNSLGRDLENLAMAQNSGLGEKGEI